MEVIAVIIGCVLSGVVGFLMSHIRMKETLAVLKSRIDALERAQKDDNRNIYEDVESLKKELHAAMQEIKSELKDFQKEMRETLHKITIAVAHHLKATN